MNLSRFLLLCAALSLPVAARAQSAVDAALQTEIAAKYRLPVPTSLLKSEAENLQAFEVFGPNAQGARKSVAPIAGQAFAQSVRVDVTQPDETWWHVMGRVSNARAIQKGDAILAVFWVRGSVPRMGGSEGVLDAFLKDVPEPQETYTSIHLAVNPNWQRVFLPMIANRDRAPGELQFGFSLGYKRQQIELGGLSLLDFGPNVTREQLPKPEPQRFPYRGQEPDAAWRRAAFARIEKLRKGDLRVRVFDKSGHAVRHVRVQVAMTRHAFKWGTSLVPSYDLLPPRSQEPMLRQALPVLFSTFNHAAVDIDLKPDFWLQADAAAKQRVIQSLKILKARGMTIHAHVLFWPSFDYNLFLRPLRNDPPKLRAALQAFIADVVARTAPYVDEWDVINEPFGNREITQLLGGPQIMVEWFQLAHQLNPRARLELNDYGLVEGGYPLESAADEAHRAYDETLIRELQRRGAPIGGLGLQSHFNAPRDPEKMLRDFDRFARLGLPLAVSEFDAKFGEFAAPQDEADFVRDFTICAFSHPAVDTFTMWGFVDQMHWLGHAPLYRFDDNGKLALKPSGQAWRDLVFKRWWTNATLLTNAQGIAQTRGFCGDYRVTVTANGQSRTVPTKITRTPTALTVRLSA